MNRQQSNAVHSAWLRRPRLPLAAHEPGRQPFARARSSAPESARARLATEALFVVTAGGPRQALCAGRVRSSFPSSHAADDLGDEVLLRRWFSTRYCAVRAPHDAPRLSLLRVLGNGIEQQRGVGCSGHQNTPLAWRIERRNTAFGNQEERTCPRIPFRRCAIHSPIPAVFRRLSSASTSRQALALWTKSGGLETAAARCRAPRSSPCRARRRGDVGHGPGSARRAAPRRPRERRRPAGRRSRSS